jgi:hypothetical protein
MAPPAWVPADAVDPTDWSFSMARQSLDSGSSKSAAPAAKSSGGGGFAAMNSTDKIKLVFAVVGIAAGLGFVLYSLGIFRPGVPDAPPAGFDPAAGMTEEQRQQDQARREWLRQQEKAGRSNVGGS